MSHNEQNQLTIEERIVVTKMRLGIAEKNLETAKVRQLKAGESLAHLENCMKELGVAPETIHDEIRRLQLSLYEMQA